MKNLSGKHIQLILGRIIIACFLLLATTIFLNGIFKWNAGGTTYSSMSMWLRGPLLFLAVFGTVLLFHQITQFSQQYIEPFHYRTLILIMWGLLIALQMVFLCNAGNLLRYDALKIYDEAVSIFYDGGVSPTTKEGYFSYYSNNHPIVVITFLLLKVGRLLHIVAADFHNGMFFLQVINLIAIDMALFFGYLFVKDILKKKSMGFTYMLFALVSPLSYVWIPFYYTNTMCMPFFMAGLWLVFRFYKKEDGGNEKEIENTKGITQARIKRIRERKNSPVHLLLAGVLFGIGFMIRATVIITVIALALTILLMSDGRKFHEGNRKDTLKKCFLRLIAFSLGIILGLCALKPFTNKYIKFDYTDTAFPTVHWIMMGADGEGTFNKKDEAFTAYFSTAEDKRNADKIMLNERLQEMGVGGTIAHAISKMWLTFSDGTGNYEQELSISDQYGKLYRYVYGDSNEGVKTYLQILYMAVFFCAILTAAKLLKEKTIWPEFVILLNLLGAFLFYMIWEAGAIYNMGFMPLYYIAFAGGIDSWDRDIMPRKWNQKLLQKLPRKGGTVFAAVMTFSILLYFGQNKADNEIAYQVNQYMFQTDNYCECTDGMRLEQTFKSGGNFDCISVQARNPLGIENDSTYEMTLLNETGDVLETCTVKAGEVVDYAFVRFKLAGAYGMGNYKLSIQKKAGNDNIIWLYYDTGNYDAYKGGALKGLPVESTMDLSFKVYSGAEKEDYFEWYSKEKGNGIE